jgi:hypothetical protein
MRLATQLRRSVFALPLLAVALMADVPAPRLAPDVAASNGLGCSRAAPVGVLGLARIPGDLGHLGRRMRCGR